MPRVTVSRIVDELQAKAVYIFRQAELSARLKSSPVAISRALSRLIEKKRIVRLHLGLFLIIPLEYQNIGAPPPVWYIDSLMEYLGLSYYVGLLTASSLYGAAHQQPAEFQVITTKQLKPIQIGRSMLKFYYKKQIDEISIQKMKSETGYFNVSIPEVTAFDLVKYVKSAGFIQNAATVLAELSSKIDPHTLANIATYYDFATVQRAGYLLETFGEKKVTNHLLTWIADQQLRYLPLVPKKPVENCKKNSRWHLIINETVEIDS
jgi:predicted transcriptional regulator of viral defense system